MVDIHSHYLPCIDDGSPSAETSLEMLRIAAQAGVTDVICTPHYRGDYKLPKNETLEKFREFEEYAKNAGLPVKLWPGQEVFMGKEGPGNIAEAPYLTLAGGKYLLAEFDPYSETGVYDAAINILSQGYIPIIAHAERLVRLSYDYIADVHALGAMIQVNAESFAGRHKKFFKDRVAAFFKGGLVDLVASDFHVSREYCMGKAYKLVEKKCGKDVAERVFVLNGKKILKGR